MAIDVSGLTNVLAFSYVNYRGETSRRRALPISIRYGTNDWHKEPQWLMSATDLDKNDDREFAMRDMSDVTEES